MDLWYLKPGHKIRTRDGAEAEVLSETEDGVQPETTLALALESACTGRIP
jgi:hypothetical protein